MTKAKKSISLLLAMAMLVSSSLIAITRSRAAVDCSNQKPLPTVLKEVSDVYLSIADIDDEELKGGYAMLVFYSIYYGIPTGDELPAEVFRNEDEKAENFIQLLTSSTEGESASDAEKELAESLKKVITGDYLRNMLLLTYFFKVGGAAGIYQCLFPECERYHEEELLEMSKASASIMGTSEEDMEKAIAEAKAANEANAKAQYFSRTLDVKEFMERVIAYYGPQKTRLADEPTYVKNDLVDSVIGTGFTERYLKDFETGDSFYDVLDSLFEGYTGFYNLKDEDMDVNKANFADLMQAIYDYMYPDCLIVDDTTTVTKLPKLFDITRITYNQNITNVSNVTNVTRLTGISGISNVSNSNVFFPF